MRNINEYKRRFDTLLESTMGNVKPLISEAPEFEEFVVPTVDMLNNHRVKSFDKVLDVKISLNGNEYKITLPEGVYNPNELIEVQLKIDKKLMISPTRFNSGNTHSMGSIHDIKGINLDLFYYLSFYFYLADNQSVFLDNQPWDGFIEIPCKNVRGGKVRFVVEVPSGSEIYEKPEDVNERDLTRIVRRVINENSNDPQEVVIECIMENTTLEDLKTIPADCVKLLSGDMTKMLACMSKMDSNTFNTIKSKIVPITKCVTNKMGGGSSFPGIEF